MSQQDKLLLILNPYYGIGEDKHEMLESRKEALIKMYENLSSQFHNRVTYVTVEEGRDLNKEVGSIVKDNKPHCVVVPYSEGTTVQRLLLVDPLHRYLIRNADCHVYIAK